MCAGLTNPSARGFVPIVSPRTVLGFCTNGSWGFVCIEFLLPVWTSAKLSYLTFDALFSMDGSFLALSCCVGQSTCCWRGWGGSGIEFTAKNSVPYFPLMTMVLLAMSIWWLLVAHTLRCVIVSLDPMSILFHVLCTFDLACFLGEMCLLTVLPNIWTYSRFFLVSI